MNATLSQLRWGVLILLAFPLVLAGQDFPRRFYRGDPTSRPYYGWGMRGMMESAGLHRREDETPTPDPTDAQWHEISEYMQRELPNAWQAYEHQPAGRQAKLKRQIFAKFQATQALRQSNQLELYTLRLKEQKLWDQTSGLIKKWRSASMDKKPAIRQQIQGKVQEAMEASLQEQELRIKKLEAQLADAKTRLADDQHNLDRIAERRSNHLLDQPAPTAEEADQVSSTTQPAENNAR